MTKLIISFLSYQTRKRKPKGAKNTDGTASKSSKSSNNGTLGNKTFLKIDIKVVFMILLSIISDFLTGGSGGGSRKNKNTKNLMLTNLESHLSSNSHQNGNGSISTSTSINSTQNLSPVSYTSQVPSPLTTITPTSSKSLLLNVHPIEIFIE